MSMPSTSGARISRAFGPCTATTAHCSVVEVSQTFRIVKLGLQIVFHMGEHVRRAACRRRHMEAIGREAPDDAVVHQEAGLAQHQAVAAAADRELAEGLV